MTLALCVLLWAHPGQEDALASYEDDVLSLLPHHSARLLQRVRSIEPGHPNEVQLYEFPDQARLDAYLADPRRTALSGRRDAAIARTELIPVEHVGNPDR
ncbi:MAG: hypothetical protein JWN36_559 [Microbacteriaceae bacterium]|nr:hypothetical protein [Microbacteriaceae bacterium]